TYFWLQCDRVANTVASVPGEVTRATNFQRRIVGCRVAESVVGRGQLLLPSGKAGDPPRMVRPRRRVEEHGVITTALGREKYRRLEGPAVRSAGSVVAIELEDGPVAEALVGVE